MGLSLIIIQKIFMMFILTLVGFICTKVGIIDTPTNKKLSVLTLKLVTPMIIFASYQIEYDVRIVKNLGITLLPQAGVALGMAMTVAKSDVGGGSVIRNIVLFGVLVYELVGPMLTKMALTRSGDIAPKEAGKTARKLPEKV